VLLTCRRPKQKSS